MDNRFFYARLALSNLRKNHSIYRPYLLAVVLLSAMFYCLHSLAGLLGHTQAAGSAHMAVILEMSTGIIGFLSILVLFYANSFVLRRRTREFGLYSILGMEKRHICRVMVWEVAVVAIAGTLLGMCSGALFYQLFLLLLQRLTGLEVLLEFHIPLDSVGATAALFAGFFLLVLVYDMVAVLRSRPIELLHSSRAGEREPKARWLLSLLGLVTLGGGYYLALSVKQASDAFSAFFPAVILVIIGTYSLFLTGTVAILKLLKRSKRFYYRPQNFIPVSSLIYRMKQNAAGLATICILSTCVLVTLSSTLCLFFGEEDILRLQYPRMVNTQAISEEPSSLQALVDANLRHAQTYGAVPENAIAYHAFFDFCQIRNGNELESSFLYDTSSANVLFLSLEDYNVTTDAEEALTSNQVLLYDDDGWTGSSELHLDGQTYEIAKVLQEAPDFARSDAINRLMVVIFPDYPALENVCRQANRVLQMTDPETTRNLYAFYSYDLAGPVPAGFYDTLRDGLNQTVDRLGTVGIRDVDRSDFYTLYGTLLFVGIFFVALFLIAAVLIIYYKQITEGFDDHDRFQILQNVGMSGREVKKVVNKQVLLVFYLPLAVAVLHIAVAFPVLLKLLQAFSMYNTQLFLLCTAGTVLAFTIFYLLTYKLTARTYFRIVHA